MALIRWLLAVEAYTVERTSEIPMYLSASFSTMLHSYWSFQTFLIAKTKLKWLRVHPHQEWFDFYRPEINDELQRSYDATKGILDGWESTPPFRLSLLALDQSPAHTVLERPYLCFPPPGFHPQLLHLDALTRTLSPSPFNCRVQSLPLLPRPHRLVRFHLPLSVLLSPIRLPSPYNPRLNALTYRHRHLRPNL